LLLSLSNSDIFADNPIWYYFYIMFNSNNSDPAEALDSCPETLRASSLLPLWRRINQEFLARVQRSNTPTTVAYSLMYLLYNSSDNEPAKLADALGIPRQSMTSTLDYLESNGFAERQPHPHDRRRKQVVLTREGRMRATAIFKDLLWLESYALQAVDAPELTKLRQFLTHYAEALNEGNHSQPLPPELKET
jgi:MarR family transcriptional regulator for hemolysin